MKPRRLGRKWVFALETARDLLERSQNDAVGVELRGLCERIGVVTPAKNSR